MVQDVFLKRADWHVRIYHDATPMDADEILDDLIRMGCTGRRLADAKAFLWNASPNQGMTYSSNGHTIMVIGRSTDAKNYWNTIDHERIHLLQHIASSRDIDIFGEEMAYVSGEFTEAVYRRARHLLCPECERKLRDYDYIRKI